MTTAGAAGSRCLLGRGGLRCLSRADRQYRRSMVIVLDERKAVKDGSARAGSERREFALPHFEQIHGGTGNDGRRHLVSPYLSLVHSIA